MLKIIAWLLMIPGTIAFIIAVLAVVSDANTFTIALAVGVFIAAFLAPAILFALADIVQYTRETRDAVLDLAVRSTLAAVGAPPARSQRSNWAQAVSDLEDEREAGARARARHDADSLKRDGSDR